MKLVSIFESDDQNSFDELSLSDQQRVDRMPTLIIAKKASIERLEAQIGDLVNRLDTSDGISSDQRYARQKNAYGDIIFVLNTPDNNAIWIKYLKISQHKRDISREITNLEFEHRLLINKIRHDTYQHDWKIKPNADVPEWLPFYTHNHLENENPYYHSNKSIFAGSINNIPNTPANMKIVDLGRLIQSFLKDYGVKEFTTCYMSAEGISILFAIGTQDNIAWIKGILRAGQKFSASLYLVDEQGLAKSISLVNISTNQVWDNIRDDLDIWFGNHPEIN